MRYLLRRITLHKNNEYSAIIYNYVYRVHLVRSHSDSHILIKRPEAASRCFRGVSIVARGDRYYTFDLWKNRTVTSGSSESGSGQVRTIFSSLL